MVPLAGCYFIFGSKHNYDVAAKLYEGMRLKEALATLSEGGIASVEATLSVPTSENWADAVSDDKVLGALLVAQARTGRNVERILVVRRLWGFMGSGIFHLFVDEQEALVGSHLRHIN